MLDYVKKAPNARSKGAFLCLSTLHGHRLLSLYRKFILLQKNIGVNLFLGFTHIFAGAKMKP